MKDLINSERVAKRLWLILLLFNMLVAAYSRHIVWMLFWAIAFSSCAYEYGYKHGKTEQRPCTIITIDAQRREETDNDNTTTAAVAA